MIITTRGIVFRFTKYRETSIIANIYTEALGLNSYIVNGVRSAKSKFKIGYFEPLNLIELTAYHQPGRNIERITEIKSAYPIHSIRQDIYKLTISLFLSEVLNKCIIERDRNQPLFSFIYNAIQTLEKIPRNNSFHLQFLLNLASYLGFGIQNPESFVEQCDNDQFYKTPETMLLLRQLLDGNPEEDITISPSQRTTILNDILHYYYSQLEMSNLKSLEVLQAIFN
jgi:DNA repair protein RecO (recombination protein O)